VERPTLCRRMPFSTILLGWRRRMAWTSADRRILLADLSSGGHHSHYLERALARYRHEEIHVLAPPQLIDGLGHDCVPHPFREEGGLRRLRFALEVARLRRRIRPAMTELLYADFGQFALHLTGALGPPGLTVAVLHAPAALLADGGSWRDRLRLGFDRWAMTRSGVGVRWVVHTRGVAEQLSGRVGAGGVFHRPYPHQRVAADREAGRAYRQQLGIPDGACVLLCFGGTRWEKGADFAASALASMPAAWHLLVAGAEEALSAGTIRTCAGTSKSRLHLDLRRVPDGDLPQVFGSADVVLLPYRLAQCESGPLGTAVLAGIPAVVADAPGWDREVLRRSGVWLFKPDDAQDLVRAVGEALGSAREAVPPAP
jgi:glycosyltransferase involved in cell wall biosynthesis